MANKRVFDLPELTTPPDSGDFINVIDISDLTESGDGTLKKLKIENLIPAEDYTLVIYVNNNNPNAATIFDDVTPPTTNDNAFKSDVDNLYIGLDSSVWIWNGTAYTTKSQNKFSNFFLNGTSADAGSNKTSPINRSGQISVMEAGNTGISLWKNTLSLWKYVTGVGKYVNIYWDNITNSYSVQFPNKAAGTETFAMLSDLDGKQNQLTAGTNITIDVTDPLAPVISASGGGTTPTLQEVVGAGKTATFDENTSGISITINDVSLGIKGMEVTDIGGNGIAFKGNTIYGNTFEGYSSDGTAQILNIGALNLNDIAKFQKDGVDKVTITHDGKITATAGAELNEVVVRSQLELKQDTLVSGTNIKTINSTSLLGSGDIVVGGGGLSVAASKTASYTITLSDVNTIIPFNISAAYNLTVPTNAVTAFPLGSRIEAVVQSGGGSISVNGAGITFLGNNQVFYIGDNVSLTKIATDTWNVEGIAKAIPTFSNTVQAAGASRAFWATGNGGFVFQDGASGFKTVSSVIQLQNYNATPLLNLNVIYPNIDYTIFNYNVTSNPTSGSNILRGFDFTPTINQTGSSSGIISFLRSNPTLTAAWDYRALDLLKGSIVLPYNSASGSYAIKTSEYLVNFTTGTFTATLPTAVGCVGKNYVLKNSGSGAITIATTSSQTIDGSTTYSLSAQYMTITVVSDGANWIIIAKI